jgi:ribosomal protein L21E
MEKKIFSDYGITLVERYGKIIALFDSGELVLQYLEAEISEEEAGKVKNSQQDAYEVIMSLGSRIKKVPREK